MFIAHLPAGYLVSTALLPRFAGSGVRARSFLWAGMLGAVAPDVDLLYFYLVDQRRHSHHAYVTHFPLLWAGLLALALAWHARARNRARAALALVFALNGLLHMVLDTLVGDIRWLAPFSDTAWSLFAVPARYHPWWLNFVLHPSFAAECAILAAAIWWWRRRFILAR